MSIYIFTLQVTSSKRLSTDLYKKIMHQEALYYNYHSYYASALSHESPGPTKYSYHRLLNMRLTIYNWSYTFKHYEKISYEILHT